MSWLVFPCILLHSAFAGCRVILPLFALSLSATPFAVGVIVALIGVLPMVFAISVGRLVDRIGVYRPMVIGACTVIGGLGVAFVFPRYETLFVIGPLVGSGFVLFHIALNHAAGVLGPPEERVKNFNLIALAFSASGFLGPLITGFSIDAIGYRFTFLLLSVIAFTAAAVLFINKVDTPKRSTPNVYAGQARFTDLLRQPSLRRVFVASASLSTTWDLFSFIVPLHGSHIGLTPSQIGLVLGAFGVAILVVRLILPLIVHRIREWQVLTTAMIASGATFFVFPLIDTVAVLIVFSFFLGVGIGGTQPLIMTLLYAQAPTGRGGEAVGVRTVLLNISQTGVPLLFGALGGVFGLTPVFWTMAIVLVASGFILRGRPGTTDSL